MTKPTSLKRNAFSLLTMQSINYIVPIVILPFLTRTLGAYEYGALNLALNLIQYGTLFITFGFNWSATRKIAQYRNNSLLVSRFFWETTLAKLILLVVACISLTISVLLIEEFKPLKNLVFIFFIQLLAVAIDPLWFFQGLERLERISIASSLIRLLNIPLLLFFVKESHDIIKVAIIQSIILLLISLIGLHFTYKTKIIIGININRLKVFQSIKDSTPIFIGAFILNLYNISTGLVLGLVSDYQNVGIYSAASRIQGAALGCFLVLTQIIFPRANHLFQHNYHTGYHFIKKVLFYSFPLVIIASLFFYFVLPKFSLFFLGPEFITINTTLKVLTPTLIFTPYSVLFLHCYLLILGHKNIFYLVPTILLILHIPYVIYFGKQYGSLGAGMALLLTEFSKFSILFIIFIIVSLKNKNRSFNEKR